jgi:transcriptional regulator with XRE-family HTH domain
MIEIYQTKAIFRIEYELICNIKALREEKGWSQEALSEKMGFAIKFVGKCESLDQPEKYNLRHMGILKKVFGLNSLDDFFPNGIPEDEQIVIHYKKVPKKKADGTESKLMENVVVKIVVVEAETKAEGNKRNKK